VLVDMRKVHITVQTCSFTFFVFFTALYIGNTTQSLGT
jgi:hypothetical protein